jgi:Secretion system C-terminal sorting domain
MKTKQIFLLCIALLGFAVQGFAQCSLSITQPGVLTCINTSVPITASGCVGYTWTDANNTIIGNSATIAVSAGGTYTVTGTDVNGVTTTAAVIVQEDRTPPTATVQSSASVLTCITTSTNLVASGGDVYIWSQNTGSSTGANATAVSADTYTVTVTTLGNGCAASASITVAQDITQPIVSISPPQMLTCANQTITLNTFGGFGFYTWSGNVLFSNQDNATVNQVGTYTVTTTNPSNGCSSSATVTVTADITPPNANAGLDKTLTCNTSCVNIGQASVTPSVTYNWSNGAGVPFFTVCSGGIYTVTVTNTANGCTGTDEVMVTENRTSPFVGISNTNVLTCMNPTAILNAFSDVNSVYTWSPNVASSTGSNATINYPDTYSVTVTNTSNGCTAYAVVSALSDIMQPVVNMISDATTLNCVNTQATIFANGGDAYIWNTGANTPYIIVSNPGTYTVTATNMTNGCTASASIVISSDYSVPILSFSSNISTLTCVNPFATLSATGGDTFSWSTNIASSNGGTAIANQAGTYTVTTTNIVSGCTASATIALGSLIPISADSAITPINCSNSTNGSILLVINGDNPPFTLQWSNNSISNPLVSQNSGTYTVTITDALGCKFSRGYTLYGGSPTVTIQPSSPINVCPGGAVLLSASAVQDGNIIFNSSAYNWSGNGLSQYAAIINPIAQPIIPTIYTVTVTGFGGCTGTASVFVNIMNDCIFPGDANNDGTADNTDLLPIALSNALTGNARLNATTQWTAQTAQNWTTNIPNTTTNRKHADCDGDGTIAANDTLVILQNYGQTHALRTPQTTNQNDPPISCVFASDTVQSTSYPYNLKANVIVGSSAMQAQNVHGLAFTINYDATIASSAYFNLNNVSWLGNANELYHLQHDDGAGHLDVAISRFDGQPRNGAGIVAECGFVIIDNVIGRGMNSISAPFNVSISDIKAITPQNMTLPMSGVTTQTVLKNMVLGTNTNPLSANIRISPNPINDFMRIKTTDVEITNVIISNTLGQVLLQQNTFENQANITIATADLPQGTYFVTLYTNEGRVTQKIVKF